MSDDKVFESFEDVRKQFLKDIAFLIGKVNKFEVVEEVTLDNKYSDTPFVDFYVVIKEGYFDYKDFLKIFKGQEGDLVLDFEEGGLKK